MSEQDVVTKSPEDQLRNTVQILFNRLVAEDEEIEIKKFNLVDGPFITVNFEVCFRKRQPDNQEFLELTDKCDRGGIADYKNLVVSMRNKVTSSKKWQNAKLRANQIDNWQQQLDSLNLDTIGQVTSD